MAQTYTAVPDGFDVWGRNYVRTRDVALSGTYPSGGYTINAQDVGLKFFRGVDVVGGDVSQGTYFVLFDFGTSYAGTLPTSVKLRLFTASGTEATGTLSPSVNVRLCAYGG